MPESRRPLISVQINVSRRHVFALGVLVVTLVAAAPFALRAVAPLNSFANNTVADAVAVNQNFTTLAAAVDALETRAGSLQVRASWAAADGSASTSTAWVDANTIDVTPTEAGNLLKFDWSHIVAVEPGSSHTRIDYRLVRTAPTAATIMKKAYVGADGRANSLLQVNVGGTAVDAAVSGALHTYKLQVRPATGAATESVRIYPRWHPATGTDNERHVLIATEYNQ